MNLFEYTYDLVRQIPNGKISSYGAVALALGDKVASRAVGRMMNQNPDANSMPCFKIVYSDGKLGGFGLGIDDKITRLNQDNIIVRDGKIVDFEQVFFNDFKTSYPLKKLREEQKQISKKISTKDGFSNIETVAGIDIAYPKNEFKEACGACVIMDYHTKEIIHEHTVHSTTSFPYIPTYLSYREYPVIEKLIKKLEIKPTLTLIDGNGMLHPNLCGLASYTGVKLNIPTIGIAKKLLTGNIENNYVKIKDKKTGYAYKANKKVKNPIYISPGNQISLDSSIKIVKNLCKYRNPEPLRLAHTLANKKLSS